LAGTVITTGLPAKTAIINISGSADGAANYDPTQTYWFSPFEAGGTPLQYSLQPGTYAFQIVNPIDAASLFPALSSAELSQVYTAWTYNSPWVTDYLAFDISALTDSSEHQLFTGAVVPMADYPGFSSAAAAYNAAKAGGYFDQIVIGTGGRYGGTVSSTYTFSSAETLVFAVPDNLVSDNAGGVSVLISPIVTPPTSTPEPGSLLLLTVGSVVIWFLGRRLKT
jgi:hypothetical protein